MPVSMRLQQLQLSQLTTPLIVLFSQAIKNSETMNRNLGWFEGRMERQIWDGV